MDEARAQASSRTSDAGQIDRRVNERELPQRPVEPAMPDRADEPAPPPDELKVLEFVLSAVVIEGATVFEAADFVPLYEDFIAREVTGADVQKILSRITKLYRDNGYFLSAAVAPPQPLTAGVLQVQVIEGYVEKVTFEGPSLNTNIWIGTPKR